MDIARKIGLNTMTSRLASAFPADRAALVTFVTAGDGDTAAILDALVEGGADVIELGMPFTDPMADGPAIQPQTCAASVPARALPMCSRSPAPSGNATRTSRWC